MNIYWNKRYSTNSILKLVTILIIALSSCQTTSDNVRGAFHTDSVSKQEPKQRGAHVYGRDSFSDLSYLHRTNIEWVTLTPFGYQEDYNSARVEHHNSDSIRILKRNQYYLKRIKLIHEAGLKVFVKPHVWITNPTEGTWRSDIYPTNEEDWVLWQETYRDFIMRYLRLAEKAKAEMFCVGTEFSRLALEKPTYWRELIKSMRKIYSGKLTYAANWYNEYEDIVFWQELDYIGIQAYFPLTKKIDPGVSDLSEGWNKHLPKIKAVHKKNNRKILFTELGYKSTSDSGIEPWKWLDNPYDTAVTYSPQTQANCYQAFFESVWPKEWFAGVHLWKWHTAFVGGYKKEDNRDFTPQGKPAEAIIAQGFNPNQ